MAFRCLYLLALLGVSAPLTAGVVTTPLAEIRVIADVNVSLPFATGGTVTGNDEALFVIDPATGTSEAFAVLPGPNNSLNAYGLDAYHRGSFTAYSIDSSSPLAGLPLVRPADVISPLGSLLFDSAAAGVPPGINVDAVSADPNTGDLLLSFDSTLRLDNTTYLPNDLVRFNGSFSLFFDGFSLTRNLNLNAAHVLDNGNILMSFENSGTTPDGLRFFNDDIIEFNPVTDEYRLSYALSALHPSWFAANINALWAERALQGGQLRFTGNVVEILENEGPVTIAVERTGGTEGATGIGWQTQTGSAGAGDFVSNSGTINYADGADGLRLITITLSNDALVEGVEEFTVELDGASLTGSATLGNPNTITVRIIDDEITLFKDGFESL
ncbi:MAG: hypothetical protein Tsb002_18140 [Wenzhouxiangellaceae bacterium]